MERPYKKRKIDYDMPLSGDCLQAMVSIVKSIKILGTVMKVNKEWRDVGKARLLQITLGMPWRMYLLSRYNTMKVVVSLGKINGLDKTGYSIKHKGVGGDTAFMIYQSLCGINVYAEIINLSTLSIPPKLVYTSIDRSFLYNVYPTDQRRVENGLDPYLYPRHAHEEEEISTEDCYIF